MNPWKKILSQEQECVLYFYRKHGPFMDHECTRGACYGYEIQNRTSRLSSTKKKKFRTQWRSRQNRRTKWTSTTSQVPTQSRYIERDSSLYILSRSCHCARCYNTILLLWIVTRTTNSTKTTRSSSSSTQPKAIIIIITHWLEASSLSVSSASIKKQQ
jgi:hypothetical protein